MDQQLSHTKYLDHLQGEWIKDTRILRMFHGALPNLIKIRRLQWKKVVLTKETTAPHFLLHKAIEWAFVLFGRRLKAKGRRLKANTSKIEGLP